MASELDHSRKVLGAVLGGRKDLLDVLIRKLQPEHFPDTVLRNVFIITVRYFELAGGILTRDALTETLKSNGLDVGKTALYGETYDALTALKVSEEDFRWSVEQLKELAAERATGEALVLGMEILRTGKTSTSGDLQKGHSEARKAVLSALSVIDRDLTREDSPEGDIRNEGKEILGDYAERKAKRLSGDSTGLEFGIPPLDAVVGGLNPGELDLLVAYSSEGKSSLLVQLAWNVAVMQRRNVVFFTTETLRPQIRRKVIARHSVLPMFNIPEGLNTRDLKGGTLSPQQEEWLKAVVHDFTTNTSYGRFHLAQVPRGATISTTEARLARISQQFQVDLVACDYLALWKSDRRRQSNREELSLILQEAKEWAATFDNGRGMTLVSPWQVNRSAKEEAEKLGYYTTRATSETSEATNISDVMVSILGLGDSDARTRDLKAQVLKSRDGETSSSISVRVDYATSTFSATAGETGFESLLGDSPLL